MWVKLRLQGACELGPFLPQQPTSGDYGGMSVRCQDRNLLDHLVGAREQRGRDGDAQLFCCS